MFSPADIEKMANHLVRDMGYTAFQRREMAQAAYDAMVDALLRLDEKRSRNEQVAYLMKKGMWAARSCLRGLKRWAGQWPQSGDVPAVNGCPVHVAEASEELENIMEAVSEMPRLDQKAFRVLYLGGEKVSLRRCAHILKVSLGTAHTVKKRVDEKIRKADDEF